MTAHEELLYWANINYHPLYERALRETYEEEHGPHFNEKYARESVAQMYSIDTDGTKHMGEHWTIEEVKKAVDQHKELIDEKDTCWDAYVALNMWWHDMHHVYKRRMQPDSHLIEDALTWSFCDSDAPEGKVWYYVEII